MDAGLIFLLLGAYFLGGALPSLFPSKPGVTTLVYAVVLLVLAFFTGVRVV